MTEVQAPQAPQQDWTIGCNITVATTFGEELSGQVFAYDKNTNCVIIKSVGSHGGVSNLRFLKTNYIKEIISVARPEGPVDLKLPVVDQEKCRIREEKALQQAELDAAKIGTGVTREAQSIFDALSKTMPCKWDATSIVVLDEVRVKQPYDIVSCEAAPEHRATLDRVTKVLSLERQRLGLKA